MNYETAFERIKELASELDYTVKMQIHPRISWMAQRGTSGGGDILRIAYSAEDVIEFLEEEVIELHEHIKIARVS